MSFILPFRLFSLKLFFMGALDNFLPPADILFNKKKNKSYLQEFQP